MDKLTPTEEKAKEKAKIILAEMVSRQEDYLLDPNLLGKECAIILCDQVIEALNSVKGMGKIHQVKFWKLVKKYL